MNLPTLNYKRIGLIVIFVIVVCGAGYLLYSFFFKKTPPSVPVETPIENGSGNGLPSAGEGTPTQPGGTETPGLPQVPTTPGGTATPPAGVGQSQALASDAAFSFINQNGSVDFYNSSDNRFYSTSLDGKVVQLSDQQFYGVEKVIWSPAGQKAVLEYPDGSNIRYDFNRKSQVTLPKHWEDFQFSPDGEKIVAKSVGLDENNRWLVVSNDDGSRAQAVQDMGKNTEKFVSSWSPNGQSVALFVDDIDLERTEIYFVGQNGENYKSTIVEGRGFQPLWSPDGKDLVYSIYSSASDYKPSLWIVGAQGDAIGSNRRPLDVNTWANKCTFGGGNLYCAVPQSLDRGAGMFDMSNFPTRDSLFRIDLSSGLRQPIPLDYNYSMGNLSISADGTHLIFIDTTTGQLRQVPLR